jgi:hypothetical protein
MLADQNDLRRLLEMGMSPQDIASITDLSGGGENALAQLLQQGQQMPQPRYDVSPMQPNTMRFENGPDSGNVVPLDFQAQQMARQQPQRIKVAGYGNGIMSDLGETDAAPVPLDYSRPAVDTPKGKGYYGKDGAVYVKGPDGSTTKILQGYDRDASWEASKRDFERRKAEASIAHENEATASLSAARNVREGIPGMGTPQSVLEKQFGKAPEGQRWTEQGTLEDVPGGSGKPLNESQGKAAGMATRAQAAHEGLLALEATGITTPGIIKQAVESVPLVGTAAGMVVNALPSALGGPSNEQQKVEQFQRDFVNAVLRPESGASISGSEFDNARKQYFPQPGDSAEVIAQKQQARAREIAALGVMSGASGAKVIQKQNAANAQAAAPSSEVANQAFKAWGGYDPIHYDYRVVNGQIQRKAK